MKILGKLLVMAVAICLGFTAATLTGHPGVGMCVVRSAQGMVGWI